MLVSTEGSGRSGKSISRYAPSPRSIICPRSAISARALFSASIARRNAVWSAPPSSTLERMMVKTSYRARTSGNPPIWSASGCVPTTTSIERSYHGMTFPSSRTTALPFPPSMSACRPLGASMNIASPWPILRNETVRSPCLSSRSATHQMLRTIAQRTSIARPRTRELRRIGSFYLHEP
ncbi:MAG: hypothetical protein UY94_C0030G0004 [Parcubacteria group bacterium GW2011_GWA2_56_21]|nr:MAG: hypothetical protein UY94_C0030G0004 [Parcubacteria group bacterium GW2011_GWA2_56_21]